MALPEQYITMTQLEQETSATLADNKRFVMFDEDKSRSASLEDIKDHILGDMSNTVADNSRQIQDMLSWVERFATALEVDDEGLVYLLNNEGRQIAGPYGPFAGGGGGGGGGGSSNNAILTLINTSGWLSKTVVEGTSCPISFAWSSTEDDLPTGNGILVVRVNNSVRINKTIAQGRTTIDVSEYLKPGESNSIKITISDVYSNTKFINYTVSTISLSISSSFNASVPRTGSFTFSYIPTGEAQKTVYFIIDGGERIDTWVTSSSGRQQNQTIPALSHGAHSLLVYFEADIDGDIVRSNELYYDIIYVDQSSTTPIIASSFREETVEQYTTLQIPCIVYNPLSLTSEVKLYVNDTLVSTQVVGRTENILTYRADTVGPLTLKIQVGLIFKEFEVTVTPSPVMAKITTENLALELQSAGRSNLEPRPGIWTYNNIRCDFANFNYSSNGWVLDGEDGDQNRSTVLRVNGSARLTIPYQPFAYEEFHDIQTTGKTIEIDFATRDVLNYDAVIISCMDGSYSLTSDEEINSEKTYYIRSGSGTSENPYIYNQVNSPIDGELSNYYEYSERGFSLTSQKAILKSAQSSLSTQYKENEHVRVSFVIEKSTDNQYGNKTYPLFYIYINGIMSGVIQYPENDVFTQNIPKNIVIGSNECTTDIYSIRIYDNNLTRYQILENWIADTQDVALMLQRYEHNDVYENDVISINKLPNDLPYLIISGPELPQKKKDVKSIDGTYVDPIDPSKSFTFEGAEADVQGTSSQFYARKNYKIKFKNGFNMTQSGESIDEYGINDGIPTKTFTFKADVASSEGANNVELVRLYNEACPYRTPPQLDESNPLHSKIRQGIDGFPIVIFWDNGNTISFLGKYNWNNDKGTPEVFGFAEGDESWETLDNSGGYGLWKEDDYTITYVDSEGKTKFLWLDNFEARYPDTKPVYTDSTNLSALSRWLVSTNQATATGNTLAEEYVDIDGNTHTIDNAAYRLAKFRSEISDHFELDSVLFMYLFTELFLMVDSRAKNAFPSFFGDDKWCFLPYDMDTAIGIDNRGELTFGYSLEDIDYVGTMPVFNGQDSVLWINVRAAFKDELQTMYQTLRNGNLITYENIESMFEAHQSKWPEAIFNEDSWFKYINPLLESGDGTYLSMALGSKSEQRKWWLYNRFRYLDSKYSAGTTATDTIYMRPGAIPENVEDRNITITPYADIYAAVQWDIARIVKERATHGVPVVIQCPYTQVGDNVINILNASQLASIGDLSGFKPHMINLSNAVRLQSIKIGSDVAGFTNPNLDEITFGNNYLLKNVDLRNCTQLGGNIGLGNAVNIEHVYLEGTKVTGVTLPDGGILKTLHLPATVTDLTILNQPELADLSLASYNNIITLRLENIPSTINIRNILNLIDAEKAKIRLVGFTWSVNSTTEIDLIFNKLDSFKIQNDLQNKLGGLDESNRDVDISQAIRGTITIPGTLTGAQIATYHARYPYITITPEHRTCTVIYLNAVGEEIHREVVTDGKNASYSGHPAKAMTNQYTYEWAGWSERNDNIADPEAQNFILMDKTLYPCYTPVLRTFTATFIKSPEDGGSSAPLWTQTDILYGETPVYGGTTPVSSKDTDDEKWTFYGWSPPLGPITENTTYVALFNDPSPMTRILLTRRPFEATGSMSYIGSFAFGYCSQLNAISFPNVTHISESAFYNCQSLTTINLPNLTTVGSYAFAECNTLKTISLSKVTSMEEQVFRGCYALTTAELQLLQSVPSQAFAFCNSLDSIVLPNTTTIGYNAFGNCGFSSVSLSNVTSIKDFAFYGCSSLRTISFPKVTNIGYDAFGNCGALRTMSLPLVSIIENEGFNSCSYLMNVNLPNLQILGQSAFAYCSNLASISLPNISVINSSAFNNCLRLQSVYILTSVVPVLENVNAFANTPLSNTYQGTYGSIYVLESMISNFRATTPWDNYSSRFRVYIG